MKLEIVKNEMPQQEDNSNLCFESVGDGWGLKTDLLTITTLIYNTDRSNIRHLRCNRAPFLQKEPKPREILANSERGIEVSTYSSRIQLSIVLVPPCFGFFHAISLKLCSISPLVTSFGRDISDIGVWPCCGVLTTDPLTDSPQ